MGFQSGEITREFANSSSIFIQLLHSQQPETSCNNNNEIRLDAISNILASPIYSSNYLRPVGCGLDGFSILPHPTEHPHLLASPLRAIEADRDQTKHVGPVYFFPNCPHRTRRLLRAKAKNGAGSSKSVNLGLFIPTSCSEGLITILTSYLRSEMMRSFPGFVSSPRTSLMLKS